MKEFSFKTQIDDHKLTLTLIGPMNESLKLPEDLPFPDLTEIVVNCEYVSLINSTAILKWTSWLKMLEPKNPKLLFNFQNSPQVVIDQMNRVRGFLPANSRVTSFYLPYYCATCDRVDYRPMALGRDYFEGTPGQTGKVEQPELVCFNCKNKMEVDVNPKSFFKFLEPVLKAK